MLSRIRVTALGPLLPDEPPASTRTVVTVVAGPGLAVLAAAMGAVAVQHRPSDEVSDDELTRCVAAANGDVVVLPNDPATLAAARHWPVDCAPTPAGSRDPDGGQVNV